MGDISKYEISYVQWSLRERIFRDTLPFRYYYYYYYFFRKLTLNLRETLIFYGVLDITCFSFERITLQLNKGARDR